MHNLEFGSKSYYLILFYYLFSIISLCFLFRKVGEKFWKGLIPFYNFYVYIRKVALKPPVYFGFFMGTIAMFIAGASSVGIAIGSLSGSMNIPIEYALKFISSSLIPSLTAYIIIIYLIHIFLSLSVGDNFGKGYGFKVGLIFLPVIFSFILAFDNSKFISKNKYKKNQVADDNYEYMEIE